MKICKNCSRVNKQDEEECVGCGGKEFEYIYITPAWLEEDNDA